ncbi:hypothetical protein [Phyllobacterium sp. A18/5-2]
MESIELYHAEFCLPRGKRVSIGEASESAEFAEPISLPISIRRGF